MIVKDLFKGTPVTKRLPARFSKLILLEESPEHLEREWANGPFALVRGISQDMMMKAIVIKGNREVPLHDEKCLYSLFRKIHKFLLEF